MTKVECDRPDTPWSRAVPDWPVWEDKHGPYSDYAAWELWMCYQQTFTDMGGAEILDALLDLDYRAKISLYDIMSHCYLRQEVKE